MFSAVSGGRGLKRAMIARLLCLIAALLLPLPAAAQVMLSFQSFNGSMFGGRFPHTFVVLQGTLEASGAKVEENYGYSAKSVSPAVLAGGGGFHCASQEMPSVT